MCYSFLFCEMKITPEFAELYGAFAGDGWISRGSGGLTLFITGNPADEKEYYWTRIRPLFKETARLVVTPRDFEYWGTFGVMVCRKKVIEMFISAGAPIGKKARIITVPDFALFNSRLFVAFSRGLFDTDGCINFQKSYNKNASVWQKANRHRPRIFFSTVSYSLAKGLQQELQKLGLRFSFRSCKLGKREKTPSFRVELEGKENAKRFFFVINPSSPKHRAKFAQWLKQGF